MQSKEYKDRKLLPSFMHLIV